MSMPGSAEQSGEGIVLATGVMEASGVMTLGISCEDCPDTNPFPPERSDCVNFDGTVCPAACTRPDSVGRLLTKFLSRE